MKKPHQDNFIKRAFARFVHHHTARIVHETSEKFRLYPKEIIWMILFLSYNVLLQGIADIVIKVGGYLPWFSPLPLRVDFLFLTAVSVLMGYQALIGMRRRELDVTRNSVSLGILVEFGLIVSDTLHIMDFGSEYPYLMIIRLPFIILTSINMLILFYISHKITLFRDNNGKFILS